MQSMHNVSSVLNDVPAEDVLPGQTQDWILYPLHFPIVHLVTKLPCTILSIFCNIFKHYVIYKNDANKLKK